MTAERFIPIKMKKEDLLAALRGRQEWAAALDAKNAQEHRMAEYDLLVEFRTALSKAMEWDYATAKAKSFETSLRRYKFPECPSAVVPQLAQAIKNVEMSSQEQYTISENGAGYMYYWLLMHDEDAKEDVCG